MKTAADSYIYMLIGVMCLILIGHFLPNLSQFRVVEGMTSSKSSKVTKENRRMTLCF